MSSTLKYFSELKILSHHSFTSGFGVIKDDTILAKAVGDEKRRNYKNLKKKGIFSRDLKTTVDKSLRI